MVSYEAFTAAPGIKYGSGNSAGTVNRTEGVSFSNTKFSALHLRTWGQARKANDLSNGSTGSIGCKIVKEQRTLAWVQNCLWSSWLSWHHLGDSWAQLAANSRLHVSAKFACPAALCRHLGVNLPQHRRTSTKNRTLKPKHIKRAEICANFGLSKIRQKWLTVGQFS